MSNITKVYLLNVPLESDYKHTLYFESKTAQQSYFAGQVKHSFTDFSYQRKDSIIRVPEHIDTLWNCNYVMYQNSAYNNKWFYAFITDMEYINDERTDIKIQTDCMQTWYFDYTSKACFVEREHVDDDTVGLHTVPEVLETGEYVCQNSFRDAYLDDLCVVLSSTVHYVGGEKTEFDAKRVNGIYSATTYKAYTPFWEKISILNAEIKNISKNAEGAINGVFMYPTKLLENNINESGFITESTLPASYNLTYNKLNGIKGHIIKNNKLLTFPYNYLLVSNNNGGSAIYHQELFEGTELKFKVIGCLTPGGSIKLVPLNYSGVPENYESSLNAGKFPICAFNNDLYTNWLTQNSVNIGVDVTSGLLTIAGGVMITAGTSGLGGVVGGTTILGGVTQIAGTIGQIYEHSFVPPQTKGNLNSGDVVTASRQNGFTFYHMCIKPEYAKIIDNYFTCYGYKVNRVKIPNTNHRSRFWYTKCIDYECDGAIPNKDMQVIKDCYNRGITFWRNANDINNYESDNNIL